MSWLTWTVVRRSAIVAGLLLFAYYVITFVQVWVAAGEDSRRPSQAIIVLGAAQYNGRPTDVFKARLDHAADLFHAGIAPMIVVTGGKQPGDRFTEAQSGANYLLQKKGLKDSQILRETTSHNSWESLAASARFLRTRGVTRVTLVSDPFHSLRIRLTAEELGFDAVTSPTRTSPISGFDEFLRYLTEAVRVAVGRIFGFGRATRVGRLVPGIAILTRSGVV